MRPRTLHRDSGSRPRTSDNFQLSTFAKKRLTAVWFLTIAVQPQKVFLHFKDSDEDCPVKLPSAMGYRRFR